MCVYWSRELANKQQLVGSALLQPGWVQEAGRPLSAPLMTKKWHKLPTVTSAASKAALADQTGARLAHCFPMFARGTLTPSPSPTPQTGRSTLTPLRIHTHAPPHSHDVVALLLADTGRLYYEHDLTPWLWFRCHLKANFCAALSIKLICKTLIAAKTELTFSKIVAIVRVIVCHRFIIRGYNLKLWIMSVAGSWAAGQKVVHKFIWTHIYVRLSVVQLLRRCLIDYAVDADKKYPLNSKKLL